VILSLVENPSGNPGFLEVLIPIPIFNKIILAGYLGDKNWKKKLYIHTP
jgi:hypothetical protein